jgi:hypothetical protein
VVYSDGPGSDTVGCEVNHPLAEVDIKTSTISGLTFDLLQTAGKILLGATDLINHTAPLSFRVATQPSRMFFGMIGFPGGNMTYYLPPTITPVASVSIITPYDFRMLETVCIYTMDITYSGTINFPDTVTFAIYKNGLATPLSITLTSTSAGYAKLDNVGVTFQPADTIDARLITVGNPNAGTFTGKILTY